MQTRQAYLSAMGVTQWRERDHAADQKSVASPERINVEGLDWNELADCVKSCDQCELHSSRTQTVFGVGSKNARLLLIGEAPGSEEDRQGEPFVGAAGQLLTAMLRAIGLQRSDVYIVNILKCQTPGNRDPKAEEVAECRAYLQRQIELIQPKLVLALGRIAAQNLLQTSENLGKLRGQWHSYGVTKTPLWVSYHPAYLLRSPTEKQKSWQDLKQVRNFLAQGS